MLQHNVSEAFSYQLKILHLMSLHSCSKTKSEHLREKAERKTTEDTEIKTKSLNHNVKKNTELFNKQVEKNLIDSVEDCAVRNKLKIPASKSLNSLQLLQQELYTFDCQGGLEELCKDAKCENAPSEIFDNSYDSDANSESDEWVENLVLMQEKESAAIKESAEQNQLYKSNEKKISSSRQNNLINEAIKVIKFFLNEMENESDTTKCKILQDALDFWIEHELPIQSIENVFLEHIESIFYPLGLLLFW